MWCHLLSVHSPPQHGKVKRLCCQHRYSKAKDVFQTSITAQDRPHAHWLLGDAMFELGELSQAEIHYRATQTDTATMAERMHALQQLVSIYKRIGDSESAEQCNSQLHSLQS